MTEHANECYSVDSSAEARAPRTETWGRIFDGRATPALLERVARDAAECLPSGTRFEIRETFDRRAVAWLSEPGYERMEDWPAVAHPGSFDVATGTYIWARGVVP